MPDLPKKKEPAATLHIDVDIDEFDGSTMEWLGEVVDKCREQGTVRKAEFRIKKEQVIDLT